MKKTLLAVPAALIPILFLLFSIISCSSDGAEGPQGPEGTAGPAGPAGPKGDNGTANVISSEWLDVPFKPDTIHLAGGGIDTVGYFATIKVPKLTKELLNSADVKAYINIFTKDDPTIYPLPYYDLYNYGYIRLSAYLETIELYSNFDPSTFTNNRGEKYQQYRYMIIPGNTSAKSISTVNWSDYSQVKKHLDLKD